MSADSKRSVREIKEESQTSPLQVGERGSSANQQPSSSKRNLQVLQRAAARRGPRAVL